MITGHGYLEALVVEQLRKIGYRLELVDAGRYQILSRLGEYSVTRIGAESDSLTLSEAKQIADALWKRETGTAYGN